MTYHCASAVIYSDSLLGGSTGSDTAENDFNQYDKNLVMAYFFLLDIAPDKWFADKILLEVPLLLVLTFHHFFTHFKD